MAITNITVSNFKSFKHLDLDLGRFNVIIGANAAGKSNFVEMFKFLKTVETNDINDAVFMHGGPTSVKNLAAEASAPLRIRVMSDREMAWGSGVPHVRVRETAYDFSLRLRDGRNEVVICDDHLVQRLRIGGFEKGGDDFACANRATDELELKIWLSEDRRQWGIGPADVVARLKADGRFSMIDLYTSTLGPKIEPWEFKTLLVRTHFLDLLPPGETLFGGCGVYDIDPHLAKKPFQVAGKPELQENGENLPLVLRKVLEREQERRCFQNLLRDLLPFAEDVGTEQFPGRSLLLTLREGYHAQDLPAHLLSDGTVNIVALLLAMYFEHREVVVIEEPERSIHPHLISRLVETMKDASANGQVVITTHSPEVVKHAGLENILLVSRGRDGSSTVSRPSERKDVQIFLQNELGVDELYVENLLGE